MIPDAPHSAPDSPAGETPGRWFRWFCIGLIPIYLAAGIFFTLSRPAAKPAALLADAKYWQTVPGYNEGQALGLEHSRRGFKPPNSGQLDAIAQRASATAKPDDAPGTWITAFKIGYRSSYKPSPALSRIAGS